MENKKKRLKFLIVSLFTLMVIVSCTITGIYLYNNKKEYEMNTLPPLKDKGIVTDIDEYNKRIAVTTDNAALILNLPNAEYCVYSLNQIKKGDQISFVYFPSDYNYSNNSVVIMSYEIINVDSIK